MSKGKQFPKRIAVHRENGEPGRGAIVPDPDENTRKCKFCIEYISLAESEHLVSKARREGRAEAFREAIEELRGKAEWSIGWNTFRYLEEKAKASERASDEAQL